MRELSHCQHTGRARKYGLHLILSACLFVFQLCILKSHSKLFRNSGIVNQVENVPGVSRILHNLSYCLACWLTTMEKSHTHTPQINGSKEK